MVIIFLFNDTATTEIYTLSLHDALPILRLQAADGADLDRIDRAGAADRRRPAAVRAGRGRPGPGDRARRARRDRHPGRRRSEEHTSELQSRQYLVCRLLLEKKIKIHYTF